MRHEDYPCCGCGPEGCIDFDTTVSCQSCGKTYHPDPSTEDYCYACQSLGEEEKDEYEDDDWESREEDERDRYESDYLDQDQMDY